VTIFLRLFVVVAGVVLTIQAMAQSPLPVPTVESHKEFLVGDWKPNSPSVIMFTDPFCPYCLKALEKKHELDNVNLFMFWYPIFGEKSDSRVAEFFRCESPIGSNVIDAVLQRKSQDCSRKPDTELETTNKQMYEAYNPPGVPALYLGGQKVSFAEVKSIELAENHNLGIKLDWERYANNQLLTDRSANARAAIYVAKNLSGGNLKKLTKILQTHKEYTWYIFPTNHSQLNRAVCLQFQQQCDGKKDQLLQSSQEIELLYGLDRQTNSRVIIDGRLVGIEHLPNNLQEISDLIN
jgi:glutaredoxin